MNRIFFGTVRNGEKYCGIEFDEGSLTPEKWDIIKHSVDTYVESIEKLKAIEDLELAEDERELYEMNHKAMENLKWQN